MRRDLPPPIPDETLKEFNRLRAQTLDEFNSLRAEGTDEARQKMHDLVVAYRLRVNDSTLTDEDIETMLRVARDKNAPSGRYKRTPKKVLGEFPVPPSPEVFSKYRELRRLAVEGDAAASDELKSFMAEHNIGGEGTGVFTGDGDGN